MLWNGTWFSFFGSFEVAWRQCYCSNFLTDTFEKFTIIWSPFEGDITVVSKIQMHPSCHFNQWSVNLVMTGYRFLQTDHLKLIFWNIINFSFIRKTIHYSATIICSFNRLPKLKTYSNSVIFCILSAFLSYSMASATTLGIVALTLFVMSLMFACFTHSIYDWEADNYFRGGLWKLCEIKGNGNCFNYGKLSRLFRRLKAFE